MTRVAFVIPNFQMGGAERVVLKLITAFVERDVEVDLVLLCREGELLSALPPPVKVISLDAKRLRSGIYPLVRYLRRRKPDTIHARMWPMTVVAIIARLLSGVHSRLVIADDGMLASAYAGRGLAHALALRTSIKHFYPLADARIAVSQGVADDLVRLGGLDPKSITVIYNPLSLPETRCEAPQVSREGKGARILAIGSLKQIKNFPLLLVAFARFLEQRPASLVILGEGPERSRLEALARDLGIAEHVSFPGEVQNPICYYVAADVFVLSSSSEAFGNVIIEAMAHGITVASTDCRSGPREILDDGRFGYLASNGDPLALAEAMGAACDRPFPADLLKARAQKISGPHIIDEYAALLLAEAKPQGLAESETVLGI